MGGSKGGGTTTITESGLGDQQFKTLSAGQGAIQDDLKKGFDSGTAQLKGVGNQVTGVSNQVSGLGTQISGLGTSQAKGFADLSTQVGNVGTRTIGAIDDLGEYAGQNFESLGKQVGEGFTNVGQGMTTGFDQLGKMTTAGFNTVGNQVNTGFGTVNKNLVDARDSLSRDISGLRTAYDGRFDEQGNLLRTGFADQSKKLDSVQSNVMGGQDRIRALVEQYGGNQDKYYADLARGQQDAAQRLGGLQTGLDQFRGDYNRTSTTAAQQQARLYDTVAGGFNTVRDDLGRSLNAISDVQDQNRNIVSQNQGIAAQVRGVDTAVQNAAQEASKGFGVIARDMSAGFQASTQQELQTRQDFVDRLNVVKNLVNDTSLNVDAGLRRQYNEMVSSFDEQGRLISRSIDQGGNQKSRAIDSQGRLLLATFNPFGERINQEMLDIDLMLRQLDRIGYQPSSAAPSSPFQQTGLASPIQ